MNNSTLIPDDQGTLRRVFGGGLTVEAQEQIDQLKDRLAIAHQQMSLMTAKHESERARLLAEVARARVSGPSTSTLAAKSKEAAEISDRQLRALGASHSEALKKLAQSQAGHERALAMVQHERAVQDNIRAALRQRTALSATFREMLRQISVSIANVLAGPGQHTYRLRPEIDFDTLVGATTTEPTNNQLLDVYTMLLNYINGALIGTYKFPFPLGGQADDTPADITVLANSNEDEALAGFPTLLERIS